MKVTCTYTDFAWFYGVPVYLNRYDPDVPILEAIPFTHWMIDWVAIPIYDLRKRIRQICGVESDENDGFMFLAKRLKKPFTRTYDWPDNEPHPHT